ncbi:MAG: site-specific DNA-methyltransferase, partial [Desulfobacterales bacterium]|nr:site-specific DNA-methyltransferase [Desulfobacterales bacterium]
NNVPVERPETIVPSGDVPGVYFKDARNMSELPDECVHLVATSPPYFVGKEYEKGMTWDEHLENIRAVMDECGRVLVPGGIIAINVGDITNFKGPKGKNDRSYNELMAHRFQSFLRKHNILFTDTVIWTKRPAWATRHNDLRDETPHCSYRIMDNWEPIYIGRKKGNRQIPSDDIVLQSKLTREQWMTYVNALWDIEPNRVAPHGHPSTYPDELVNRLVRMFSYVGDTVLDPFLGSGTTVKVARELAREAIGYERELQYKAAIMKKLGLPFVDTLENVQQTLRDDNWAPDLSAEETPSETAEGPEAEEAIALAAEVGTEA